MSAFFSDIMKGNKALWAIYFILVVLSCVVTFSAMSQLALDSPSVSAPLFRHLIFLICGFALIVLIQNVNFKVISLSSLPILMVATAILVFVTATGGAEKGGANRFSQLGMPSEYVKLGLILTLSDVIMNFRKRKEFPVKLFWIVMAIVGVLIFLIFLENLSSAILIYSIVFVMMVAGGVDLRRMGFVLLLTIMLAGAVISVAYVIPEKQFTEMAKENVILRKAKRAYTWKARIERWFEPENEAEMASDKVIVTDKNRQEVYAYVAVCRGGWTPNGLGSSLQRNYLPEAFSDYVFAIAVEEWGFGMGMLIIALYLSIFGISLYYIRKEERVYRKMLLLGCSFAIVIQAAVHIAVSVGAMPVTGQTLPLVSRGGASILVVSVMMGILIKITAQGAEEKALAADAQGEEQKIILTDTQNAVQNDEQRDAQAETQNDEENEPQNVATADADNGDDDLVVVRNSDDDDSDSVFIIEE